MVYSLAQSALSSGYKAARTKWTPWGRFDSRQAASENRGGIAQLRDQVFKTATMLGHFQRVNACWSAEDFLPQWIKPVHPESCVCRKANLETCQ